MLRLEAADEALEMLTLVVDPDDIEIKLVSVAAEDVDESEIV